MKYLRYIPLALIVVLAGIACHPTSHYTPPCKTYWHDQCKPPVQPTPPVTGPTSTPQPTPEVTPSVTVYVPQKETTVIYKTKIIRKCSRGYHKVKGRCKPKRRTTRRTTPRYTG